MNFKKTVFAFAICAAFLGKSEAMDYPPSSINRSDLVKLRENPEGFIEVNCQKFRLASQNDKENLPSYVPYTTWYDSVSLDTENSDFRKGLFRYTYADFLGGWTSGQREYSFTLQRFENPSDFISFKKENSFEIFQVIDEYIQNNNNDFVEIEEEKKEPALPDFDLKTYGSYKLCNVKSYFPQGDVLSGNLFVKTIQIPASGEAKEIRTQGGLQKKMRLVEDNAGYHMNIYLIKGENGKEYIIHPEADKKSGSRSHNLSLINHFGVSFSEDLNKKSCHFKETGYDVLFIDEQEQIVKTLPTVRLVK